MSFERGTSVFCSILGPPQASVPMVLQAGHSGDSCLWYRSQEPECSLTPPGDTPAHVIPPHCVTCCRCLPYLFRCSSFICSCAEQVISYSDIFQREMIHVQLRCHYICERRRAQGLSCCHLDLSLHFHGFLIKTISSVSYSQTTINNTCYTH